MGHYFGRAGDSIRPFVGLGASYAFFMDVKATDALNTYEGGRVPGDTTISLKNALGIGPFLGVRKEIDEDWSFNLSVGKLRYKTEATLVTQHTTIASESRVLKDLGPNIVDAVNVTNDTDPATRTYRTTDGLSPTTALMCDLAAARNKNSNCDLGAYVRKAPTVLDNTLFMFSVGRRF
ncbi:MAG: OmpW family outer membrane protein [Aquabacterium sp.]